jgi:3-dehydroquinate dehydratase type I
MICIPIIAKNSEAAIEKIMRANPIADMLEIRLDGMESFHLEPMLETASNPVIVTYRSKREGGKGSAEYGTLTRYLLDAVNAGTQFVDVEFSMPLRYREGIFRDRGTARIILSAHLLNGTPGREELEDMLEKMAATGADIVKIVTRARAMEDNLRILHLIGTARRLGIQIITFCMGPMGRISRIAAPLLGGYLTFASLAEGEESADGQMPLVEMKKVLNLVSS